MTEHKRAARKGESSNNIINKQSAESTGTLLNALPTVKVSV